MYIPKHVSQLLKAAKDAAHCLAAVNDESLARTINVTSTRLERAIELAEAEYAPKSEIFLPPMDWVKNLPRPVSAKDAFMMEREAEAQTPTGYPFK